jgi:alkylation response protein AidB-like acyl-CoA dehydrogenase
MMDFHITEEQELIRQSIAEFAVAADYQADPYQALKGLGEPGFLGIFLPENYGGGGETFMSFILSVEEMAKVNATAAFLFARQSCLAGFPLAGWGTEKTKQSFLPALCGGTKYGAFAYGEGGADTDLTLIKTRAVRDGTDFIISGQKTFVVNATRDSVYILCAQTGENEVSAFVLDGTADGVSIKEGQSCMGLEGMILADVVFTEVRVPDVNMLGEPGQGAAIAAAAVNLHNIATAAIAVGICERALDKCLTYGKERIQFGRPIIHFDALQTMVGLMEVNLQAAQLLTYHAAALKDEGKDFAQAGKIARYFAQTTGEQTCSDAIQVHGGYGYSKDMGVEILLRDIKGLALFDTLSVPLLLEVTRSLIRENS